MTSDLHELGKRWDAQQAAYIAGREQRFDAMLDVLALTAAAHDEGDYAVWARR